MPLTPLQSVRESCKFVVENATHVTIDEQRCQALASRLSTGDKRKPSWDAEQHYTGPTDRMAAFVTQASAVNFGLGSHSALRVPQSDSPYFFAMRSLARHFETQGPLSLDELGSASAQSCASLFKQDVLEPEVGQLMQAYAQGFDNLSTFLRSRHEGSLENLFTATAASSDKLIDELQHMVMYQDVADYRGKTISFFARAQMMVSDLNLIGSNHPPYNFDVDKLTAFANETVPHLLHCEGVLRYALALADKIAAQQPLSSGGEEEIEIRANAIEAIERISAYTQKTATPRSPRDIDYVLWLEANHIDLAKKPSHFCKTIFY